jgi:hypothetical protein
MQMELNDHEQKVIEALRKAPKQGSSRLTIALANGKIVNIDLTAELNNEIKNKNPQKGK